MENCFATNLEVNMDYGIRSRHALPVLSVFFTALFILAPGYDAMAGDCDPDSGFEWCYEYPNEWTSTPKIQVDIDYNTAIVSGHKVAQGEYIMRFKCNGTFYYGGTSCNEDGCNGQNLGGGTVQKTIATAYTNNAHMDMIICFVGNSNGWAWASYDPWDSGVKVVSCYENSHCDQCEYCSTSGSPSGWQCQTSAEVCNGIDDNCNGQSDENWPDLGSLCTAGTGECEQQGVKICNAQGTGTKCSVSGGNPQSEQCDSLDNDCDGAIDEGFGLGSSCCTGEGLCQNCGQKVCKWDGSDSECNVSPYPPQNELCDGLDNDCDGVADENFDLGSPCSAGTGQCLNVGQIVCKADTFGSLCSADPLPPSLEQCDGLDNDCDGLADEDLGMTTCGLGPCQHTVDNCLYGQEQVCDPFEGSVMEICDGIDNDCDGPVDEDFDLGMICTVGLGQCSNVGIKSCTQSGLDTECNVEPLPGGVETCDGLDNDCDGMADEDFNLASLCQVGVGECENTGVLQCAANGQGTECSVQPLPSQQELCDAKDNDCDGNVDEDFELGAPCTVGTGQCLNSGFLICSANGFDTECSVQPLEAVAESCDGKDNDCDGATDEDYQIGEICSVGMGECSIEGLQICSADQEGIVCDAVPGSGEVEICDGLDNDCDGTTDEDFLGLGGECALGLGECVAYGELQCSKNGDSVLCNAIPLSPADEICDLKDNNCEGSIDEGCSCEPGDERSCGSSLGECASGTQLCGDDGVWGACESAVWGTVEICDGFDNDCDGIVDPACPCQDGTEEACGAEVGECVPGSRECVNGAWGPCVGASGPTAEICDGFDNDCDGLADQLYPELESVCDVGVGACLSEGILVCSEDGMSTVCDADPGEASEELCNDIDDDCDAEVDEEEVCTDCIPGETMDCDPVEADCEIGTKNCDEYGTWQSCVPSPDCGHDTGDISDGDGFTFDTVSADDISDGNTNGISSPSSSGCGTVMQRHGSPLAVVLLMLMFAIAVRGIRPRSRRHRGESS